MGFGHLLKWEGLRDDGFEMSAREAVHNQLTVTRKAFRTVPDLRGHPTSQAQTLERRGPVREDRWLATQAAIDNDHALLRGGLRKLVHIRSAYGIEDNPRAPAVCYVINLCDQIRLIGDDHMLSALLLECRRFGIRSRNSDRHCAGPPRQLYGRDPNTARRCTDDDVVPQARTANMHDRKRREVLHPYRGRLDGGQTRRRRKKTAHGNDRTLG